MKRALGTGNPGWSLRDLNGMRPTWQKKPAQSTLLLPIKENRKNIAMLVYNRDEDVLE